MLDKLVYTATNPVTDGLVEQVHHWPGPKTVRALLDGRTLRARRPHYFFRDDGPMPEEVELAFTLPPELGDASILLAQLRARIASVEAACAHARGKRGRGVLGRRRVLQQSWRAAPTSHEPRRNLRPRVAARSKWARIEALQRNRDFIREYHAETRSQAPRRGVGSGSRTLTFASRASAYVPGGNSAGSPTRQGVHALAKRVRSRRTRRRGVA